MKFTLNKKIIRSECLFLVRVAILAILLSALNVWDKYSRRVDNAGQIQALEQNNPQLYYNGSWYAPNPNLQTILMLGIDKYAEAVHHESYNNNAQSDFLLLLIVNHQLETIDTLPINRDTMTSIKRLGVRGEEVGRISAQIALAHAYGTGSTDSCQNAVWSDRKSVV